MSTRRKHSEWTLKRILSAIQDLASLERAKALGLLGYTKPTEKEELAQLAEAVGMPLAAMRIREIKNVQVASRF